MRLLQAIHSRKNLPLYQVRAIEMGNSSDGLCNASVCHSILPFTDSHLCQREQVGCCRRNRHAFGSSVLPGGWIRRTLVLAADGKAYRQQQSRQPYT